MGRYRKRALEINAIQFTGDNGEEIAREFGAGIVFLETRDKEPYLQVVTAHGDVAYVRIGDWIVPDSQPETFYPIKPDVFAKTYDIAGGPTHHITLSVLVNGPDQWTKIFGQFSELAENLGTLFPSVLVTSHQYDPFVVDEENETDSEDTLFKVQKALAEVMPLRDVSDAINRMQNAGILFRERT